MTKDLETRLSNIKRLISDKKDTRNRSKYSYIDVYLAVELIKQGARLPQIAAMYNCAPQTITNQIRKEYPDFDARQYPKWRKDIDIEQVVNLYNKLKSSTRIAKLLGVETHVITSRLEKAGIKRRPIYNESITAEEVVRLYQKYKRTVKVAAILNTNISLIRRRLEEAGVELDLSYRRELRRTDIPNREVLEMYDAGESIAAITREYNCSQYTIRKILVKNSRKIRKR